MQEMIKERVLTLINEGVADRVLAWEKGEFFYDRTPKFFNKDNASELKYDSFCGANVTKYLIAEMAKEGKTVVLVKPCDSYSLNQLCTEHRVNRDNNPTLFFQVYMQQLEELFYALAKGKTVQSEKKNSTNCENAFVMYNHIVSWVNDSKVFMALPDTIFSEGNKVLCNEPFRMTNKISAELGRVLSESESAVMSDDE